MEPLPKRQPDRRRPSTHRLLAVAVALGLLFMFLQPRRPAAPSAEAHRVRTANAAQSADTDRSGKVVVVPRGVDGASAPTAEQVVARKLGQFARGRLELAEKMAAHFKVELQDDVRRFFAAVEKGNWEEIEVAFEALSKRHEADPRSPDLDAVWRTLLDTYGAAQEVHEWPAQKLLDYGNGILASLRPGMVYVGGSDSGCFIPTFLNETSEGERHIVLTQNALADGTYLKHINYLYGDQMQMLTEAESKKAIDDYFAEAWKRRQHDDAFPDEPKQVRPGEDIKMVDGKINVSGQPAVWDINNQFLQALLAKNPDLSFGYEESFPLKSVYADAVPLGSIMELRAADAQESFTAERAAQTLDHWRDTTRQLLADAESSGSPEVLKTYSHTAVAQANLLAARDHPAAAEQTYRLASQLWPTNPDAVVSLAVLLDRTGRATEARQVMNDFIRANPGATDWSILPEVPAGTPPNQP